MISEQDRHLLYQRLEAVLGPNEATTLMEHLPPVGWADVATKRDLDHFAALFDAKFDTMEARFDSKFDTMEARFDSKFDALESRFDTKLAALETRLLRTFVFANFGTIATAVSLTYAAVRLAG